MNYIHRPQKEHLKLANQLVLKMRKLINALPDVESVNACNSWLMEIENLWKHQIEWCKSLQKERPKYSRTQFKKLMKKNDRAIHFSNNDLVEMANEMEHIFEPASRGNKNFEKFRDLNRQFLWEITSYVLGFFYPPKLNKKEA